jgi:hypothetical protein
MKCKFLKPMQVVNPMWSDADASAAARAKIPYHVPQLIDVGAGFEVEDPQAWIHCCPGEFNAPAIAVAADDECREAVRVWMEEKRPKQIALIKAQVEQINMIKDPRDRQHLMAMAEAYGLLPGRKAADVPAASPETASPAADEGVPDAGHI